MFAICFAATIRPERFASHDEAVEFAQERTGYAPGDPWGIVALNPATGLWE